MWRAVILLIAALATLPQTHCDDDKRSFSSLARNGDLPLYARTWNKKMHPMMASGKRYVGALAKNAGLPYGKRDDETEDEDQLRELWREILEEKRNLASLARGGSLTGKRSVEALARAGYLPVPKQPEDSEEYSRESAESNDDVKRNIGALARNGYMKRDGDELDELMQELYEKRNVASLMRNGISPFSQPGKRYLGSIMRNQRNIGAMARNWHLPDHVKFGKRDDDESGEAEDAEEDIEEVAKRYVAALLRHGRLPVGGPSPADISEDKRHIGSLASKGSFQVHKKSVRSAGSEDSAYNSTVKAEENKRSKRQAAYLASSDEVPMPVMQNTDLFDYEDLADVLNGEGAPEKRFLGSVARSGWFRNNGGNSMLHTSTMTKRHIGSLARLGWLPAFRSSRYSRSGRASPAPPDEEEEEHSRSAHVPYH